MRTLNRLEHQHQHQHHPPPDSLVGEQPFAPASTVLAAVTQAGPWTLPATFVVSSKGVLALNPHQLVSLKPMRDTWCEKSLLVRKYHTPCEPCNPRVAEPALSISSRDPFALAVVPFWPRDRVGHQARARPVCHRQVRDLHSVRGIPQTCPVHGVVLPSVDECSSFTQTTIRHSLNSAGADTVSRYSRKLLLSMACNSGRRMCHKGLAPLKR